MDRMKYWLLDSAVEYIRDFGILLSSKLQEDENLRPHNCDKAEVIDALLHLLNTGDILASRFLGNTYCHKIVPNLMELETALDNSKGWFYYLTPQGGAKWEAVSKVNWRKCYMRGEAEIPLHEKEYESEEESVEDHYQDNSTLPGWGREKILEKISLLQSYILNNGGFDLISSRLEGFTWLQSTLDVSSYSIVDENGSDLTEINREILRKTLCLDIFLSHIGFDLISSKPEEWNLEEIFQKPRTQKNIQEEQEEDLVLVGMNRKLLEKILLIYHFLFEGLVVPDSEIWEIVKPWKPTYWKILPSAHRVHCKVKYIHLPPDLHPMNTDHKNYSKAWKWSRQATKWHTSLFEY
jgi:hypothetical protein